MNQILLIAGIILLVLGVVMLAITEGIVAPHVYVAMTGVGFVLVIASLFFPPGGGNLRRTS